jgi:hypothetical protein
MASPLADGRTIRVLPVRPQNLVKRLPQPNALLRVETRDRRRGWLPGNTRFPAKALQLLGRQRLPVRHGQAQELMSAPVVSPDWSKLAPQPSTAATASDWTIVAAQIGAIIVIERPRPPGTQGFALPIENEADSSRKDKMRLERSPRFLPKQHALCPVSFVAIASAMLRAVDDEPVSSAREACPAR